MKRPKPSAQPLRRAILLIALVLAGCGGGGSGSETNSTGSTGTNGTTGTTGTTSGAAFTPSTAAAVAGQIVQFTDASSGSPSAWAWDFGDGSTSTQQNTGHAFAAPGTYTVTLTATTAAGKLSSSQRITVGQTPAGSPAFNMVQTLSDQAQRTTLAFDGLALMTGNLAAQSFFPPGKVADYTGFQYLRDNDPDNMGHNTSFLTRVANNVLYILNDAQFAQLKALATSQLDQINQYGYQRFTLMQAFRRQMDGNMPSGTALNLDAVKAASRALYLIDGQISFDRALLYANLYRSLDASQKAYLDAMKGKGWASWPDIADAQIKAKMAGLPQGTAVAVMTYASDLFSWYAGSVDADVYFCPERHGTYYGGFYIKDAPAVGHEGYSISEQLTATAGAALSDAGKGYVTTAQAATMSSLVDTQRANLYTGPTNIVQLRTDIALLLRSLRVSAADADAVKAKVLALSATYGELDGENNYRYATVFTQVYASLSAAQKIQLAALRHSILSGSYANGTPFDYTTATAPYLYAAPITDVSTISSYLAASDALFAAP
ncbi:PKD domain-containing protein [Niveibacterium microcysteis]|uniref:PKD domain-containing protein n=1 Tax=Niveibacterium microcysteis TaxID=2811415 RepID=A0ABX7M182_9RHOO|nr:PKD domain-containing protein [Niveibacterium microcysteis]QSI75530.1 PKD domain-containing protein [Niveibacterium microcysteis]